MEKEPGPIKPSRPRGRPRKKQPTPTSSSTLHEASSAYEAEDQTQSDNVETHLSAFSQLLQHILKRERSEIARVAHELDVSENTIYRWMSGHSEPRATYLKQLLDALPEHRRNLSYAINQTFPNTLEAHGTADLREAQKDIYRRVLDLWGSVSEDEARRWQISQAIFEYAQYHLDSERKGINLTYAELMLPREDGIHSLYEAETRGTYPWAFCQESKAFLGSTTLAGTAAMLQRMQTWDDLDAEKRQQYIVEEFERSACACPVMHAGNIAGVLTVSSTQPDFFTPAVCQAVVEYARLLALAMKESNFYACSDVRLRPMPDLHWQREQISRSFMNRVILCARKDQVSRPYAEMRVRREIEEEFEHEAHLHLEGYAFETEAAHPTLK